MKRIAPTLLLTALVAFLLAPTAWAQPSIGNQYHEIQVLDENGMKVTDVNSVYIYLPGTTTNQTIYKDARGALTITLPMTEASTNTTLTSAGRFTWYGQDTYDFMLTTDGGAVASNARTQAYNGSIHTILFPYFLTLASAGAVELVTADDVLTAAESGKTFVCDGNSVTVKLTLPSAAAGLRFTFVDANAVAASDLQIQTATGDTVEGGSAGGHLLCEGDTIDQFITLIAVDSTRWLAISKNGTWTIAGP